MANYIGLIIALITVAGTLLANFFQFKKDGNRISMIDATTSKLEPQVNYIRETSKESNDSIRGTLIPDVESIINELYRISGDLNGDLKGKVDSLAEDLNYRKRISAETAGGFSRDYIVNGIDEVYKENLHLKNIIENHKEKIRALEVEKEKSLEKIRNLESKTILLERRLRELQIRKDTKKDYSNELDF